MWIQKEIRLRPRSRGFHIITPEILPHLTGLESIRTGICNLFIQHTSASLAINENADPAVRRDFETFMDDMVPERFGNFTHTFEGADDMPAHIKASIFGPSLTIPVTDGRLNLGTWQGIYLCEHRDSGGPRTVIATLHGE